MCGEANLAHFTSESELKNWGEVVLPQILEPNCAIQVMHHLHLRVSVFYRLTKCEQTYETLECEIATASGDFKYCSNKS